MDTQEQILKELKKLTALTDEANAQRESLLARVEKLEQFIEHINSEISLIASTLSTQN